MSLLDAGIYRPGATPLHRVGPGPKLAALAVLAIVAVVLDGPIAAGVILAIAVAAALSGGLGRQALGRIARSVLLLVVVLFAFQWWQRGWAAATELVVELVAFVVAAAAVTATTAIDDMVDTVGRLLRPFRRFGVNPDAVGFTISLAIRSIPVVERLARETGDAARARGLDRNLRAFATPFVIRTVAHARDTGAALHARGIGDEGW